MVEPVILPFSDFQPTHIRANDVLALIGSTAFIQVARYSNWRAGRCYQNVMQCVRLEGGQIVPEWMIELVDGVYIQAMHHALWRKPSGIIIDITAPQTRHDAGRGVTTFIEDHSIIVDYDNPIPIQNRHIQLVEDGDVAGALNAYRQHDAARRALMQMIENDRRYTRTRDGFSGPPHSVTYPELSAEIDRSYKDLHGFNQKILDRYF
ncbi:MAG: hypothetical protein WBO09_12365 [Methylocystis silviterrae]|uniref:hypothetical protein n=1 Tax=Methylocystis silviterrae TaxID=2743612 RepID=UPI003C76708B